MKKKILYSLLTAFATVVGWQTFAQSIIYEDTSASGWIIQPPNQMQFGDEVHAAGSARQVTQLQIGLATSQEKYPGTADLVLRLYDNTGPAGAPGSLLWQSAVYENVTLPGPPQLFSFDVPNVFVPDVFTWTIQVSNSMSNPVDAEIVTVFAGAPSVGSSPTNYWVGDSGSWYAVSPPPGAQGFAARVFAVPEPRPDSLLVFGVVLLILRAPRIWCVFKKPRC